MAPAKQKESVHLFRPRHERGSQEKPVAAKKTCTLFSATKGEAKKKAKRLVTGRVRLVILSCETGPGPLTRRPNEGSARDLSMPGKNSRLQFGDLTWCRSVGDFSFTPKKKGGGAVLTGMSSDLLLKVSLVG